MFLQLTSRDATIYVYKKTIFEINNEFKKINNDFSCDSKEKMKIINSYINLYKSYINKIIENNSEKTNILYINIFEKISEKLNRNLINKNKIEVLENIVDKLYNNVENLNSFFEINQILVKKFIKNPNILDNKEKKIFDEVFVDKINETPEKFVSWLIN
jgi:cob(I)alamin adenosyltransferase